MNHHNLYVCTGSTMIKKQLQNGIFYLNEPKIGDSCCLVFLRMLNNSTASEMGNVLLQLWGMLKDLEKGKVKDLEGVHDRHLYPGNLSILIGYGAEIFSLKQLRRKKPHAFSNQVSFKDPNLEGGGPIISGSDISYSNDIRSNHATSDAIVLQFIGNNEFVTSRAAIETSKLLSSLRNSEGYEFLYVSKIYTGFQRQDKRSWLGFHDGVSNLPSNIRLQIIAIDENPGDVEEMWTSSGTYMGFLRTEIDLKRWDALDPIDQSKIIGRDKMTGCPLIGVDKNGKPIKDNSCPVRGTYEVIEAGNEIFRELPIFGNQKFMPLGDSDKILENSHIVKANPKPLVSRNISESYRIFRQGFEYLESTELYPGFRVGLNFISYQNDPKKLFNILEQGFGKKNPTNDVDLRTLEEYFSVRAAGIFFVPPLQENEPFPGAGIFLDDNNRTSLSVTPEYSIK
jgi:deferrochelatase/peroxidase EfeB